MQTQDIDIVSRINEIRYADENREKLREERILNDKRTAAKKMVESGNGEMLKVAKKVTEMFSGSEVQSITLAGKNIFTLEPPIDAKFKKEAPASVPASTPIKAAKKF